MIITRTPMRISIGGGGTDLPSCYRQFGGFVISAAINKYVYITINRSFRDGYLLKYSHLEQAKTYDEVRHPLFREALRLHAMEGGIEIVSIADVPRAPVSARPGVSLSAWYTRSMHTSASQSPPRRWPARRSTSR
jgi:D-glycero-alpha-D-manno-heptose-7-phosphate kinase